MTFESFLSTTYWNNTGQEYLIALGVLILLFAVLKIFDSAIVVILRKGAKRTKIKWDDLVIDFISAINWQFYAFISFYIGTLFLTLPEVFEKILYFLLLIFVAYYVAQGLSRMVDHFTQRQLDKREGGERKNTSMIKAFGVIFKIAIYAVAILMILDNFGIEITPLVASLGIGGIAIAIALQSVLGDLFSAFAIYFDKPFKEGDFIIIGDDLGTVKHIGIKTTRIETLQGQELIVSNTEMTSTRVNNYGKMKKRRIVFSFGVEYSTSVAKLKKINKIVEKILKEVKNADLDRVHFKTFGDFSLNYEVVYYVNSSEYLEYMNIQQEINLKLKEAFEKENIVFAFPTQTLHIEGLKKGK